MRRKKVTYPPPKTATRGGGGSADDPRTAGGGRSVSIDLAAMTGRAEIRQGLRVRITTGLYAGELATVESVVGGVIPAAVVRTDAGRTRRMRTVDLVPDRGQGQDGAAAPGGVAGRDGRA